MRSRSKLNWVRLNFRVNDLEFAEALIRPCDGDATDFQLVVEHRFLGSFALHEEFFLELCEGGRVADWLSWLPRTLRGRGGRKLTAVGCTLSQPAERSAFDGTKNRGRQGQEQPETPLHTASSSSNS